MDELLVYASPRKLRWYQLAGVAIAAVVPVAFAALEPGVLEWVTAGLVVIAAAVAVVSLEFRIQRPKPVLRLSSEGIEGTFGLIAWEDVTGAVLLTRLRLHSRGVVLRLRPGALLRASTRELADAGQELFADRLELETRGLELGPDELLREIERYRLYASS